jgi:hypothetical protein
MCVYNCKHSVLFIDIDECINNPCMNGGTCNNMPGYYECICPVGWYGSKCQMIQWNLAVGINILYFQILYHGT